MDLQNSGIYGGKAIEVDKDVEIEKSSPCSQDTFGKVNSWPNEDRKEGDFIGLQKGGNTFAPGGSVCFGQPIVGLNLGMPKNSENLSTTTNSRTSVSFPSTSSNTAKRSRVSFQSMQTSRCQVEGCNLDLTSAKGYHRRHRICESHSKSPKVIVAGVERRFCQQCSRFHNLSEFDDKKRSCRRRLSDHNARRRRPQPEALHLSAVGPSSSLYDRRPPNFLLNRMPSSSSNTTWESSCSLKMTEAGNSLIRTSGVDASAANSHSSEAQALPRALSLLSTNTWGLNEPESTSLDHLMQGAVSIAQPIMQLEAQNWPWISSHHVSAEEAHSISPVNPMALQSNDSSHIQDFLSFKPPYESGFHFSSRIN